MISGGKSQWTVRLVGLESPNETLKKTQKLKPHGAIPSTKTEVGMVAASDAMRTSGPLPWERGSG